MEQLNPITEENCAMVGAYPLFHYLKTQKQELAKLKPTTMNHVWISAHGGKLEIVPTDDEFSKIQDRIALLEKTIASNEAAIAELNEFFSDFPVHDMSVRIDKIDHEIVSLKASLNIKIMPFRQAAEVVHANYEEVAEVKAARAETLPKIKALEQESAALKAKLAEIDPILQKAVRA